MASYLVIGHVTRDVTRSGVVTGGTVAYAAAMAAALGFETRMLTAGAEPVELPTARIAVVPSAVTTTFEYDWVHGQRRQRLTLLASVIHGGNVPESWLASTIWHLGPVIREIDAHVLDRIPQTAFVGVTPQGWLRSVREDGLVTSSLERGPSAKTPGSDVEPGGMGGSEGSPGWGDSASVPEEVLTRANAIVISDHDLPEAHATARRWSQGEAVVVVTSGSEGATMYVDGSRQHIPAFRTEELDELGAGDVFAAALFTRLALGHPPLVAGQFASAAASLSLRRQGPFHPPQLDEIETLLATHAADAPAGAVED